MNAEMSINVDGHPDVLGRVGRRMFALREQADRMVCLLDARIRMLTSEPEEGAATAEYAVVLVAATGFAAVLVGIMKSDAVKTMLTNIIKESTELLCYGEGSDGLVYEAFGEKVEDSSCRLEGVVSRKKQLIPKFMNALQQ